MPLPKFLPPRPLRTTSEHLSNNGFVHLKRCRFPPSYSLDITFDDEQDVREAACPFSPFIHITLCIHHTYIPLDPSLLLKELLFHDYSLH